MSKINVELRGMTGGRPAFPYPSSGGIVSVLSPPSLIPATPSLDHLAHSELKRERLAVH